MRELLTAEEAAQFLGLTVRTLYNKKNRLEGPRCEKRGSKLFYPRAELEKWHENTKKVFVPKINK